MGTCVHEAEKQLKAIPCTTNFIKSVIIEKKLIMTTAELERHTFISKLRATHQLFYDLIARRAPENEESRIHDRKVRSEIREIADDVEKRNKSAKIKTVD
jgi:hypothetical protein